MADGLRPEELNKNRALIKVPVVGKNQVRKISTKQILLHMEMNFCQVVLITLDVLLSGNILDYGPCTRLRRFQRKGLHPQKGVEHCADRVELLLELRKARTRRLNLATCNERRWNPLVGHA